MCIHWVFGLLIAFLEYSKHLADVGCWLQDVSGQTQQGDGSGYGAAGAGAAAGGAAAATQVATLLLVAAPHFMEMDC